MLAGCAHGFNAAPLPLQGVPNAVSPQTGDRVLYSFTGYPSGQTPTGLTALRSAFYGTVAEGGTYTFGGVFVRNSKGVRMLYNFKGGEDGAEPEGALVALNDKLYGTTGYGGASGDGTVFEISPSGAERIIYSFKGGTDGATPILGTLVVANGTLYGTTSAGGDAKCRIQGSVGCGIVYSVTTAGAESVLYRFSGRPDGAHPVGALTDVNGAFYGTTAFGGAYGKGSVFRISDGALRTLHSFKGYPDGAFPYAGVIDYDGTIYGTTAIGGAYDDSGTVFSIDSTGSERVLHSFKGYPDGAVPYDQLTEVDGVLYGTTQYGGHSGQRCIGRGIFGCGIIFSISTTGKEEVLYKFEGVPDGANPWSGLILDGRTLYGTTVSGGADGKGSIFSFELLGVKTR
ncbi:MAG TPA: choice-of-anchor tandem repeat GloVer-containing protein [Candidatus Cybelea sp.]|nr:choice-of-anchor tandem repeat GloVer-containing protein [Candidatus Cybelea sp.]